MSTLDTTSSPGGIVENYREQIFISGVILGVFIFVLALALFIVAMSMNTKPPAPYFKSSSAKLTVVALSLAGMGGGVVIARTAARLAGW